MLGDIVITALERELESLRGRKSQMEHTFLTHPMEELEKLNDQLKDVIVKHGVHSLQAQQFMRDNLKLQKDIQRRIQAQAKKGAMGKAMEDLASIENNIKTLEDELCIRKMLNKRSFSRA